MKKRKDGRYQKKITMPNGKSKIVYGATKKEVNEKADWLKLEYAMGKAVGDNKLTLSDWIITWWESNKKGKTGHKSQEGYKNAVNNYISPALGYMQLSSIKPIHIQNLINDMGKNGRAKSTQKKVLIALNSIFKYAVVNGLILGNPAQYIELHEVPVKKIEALTIAQLKELLSLAKGTRAELAVHLCVFCGIRRGELVALRWSDIDLQNARINITKSVEFIKNQPVEKAPKSASGVRSIPIPTQLLNMIKNTNKTSLFVIPNTKGLQMSEKSAIRLIEPLQEKTSFRWSFHVLRHTYATLIDMLGVNAKTCQYLLGHAQLSTTKNIYTHIRDEHLQLADEKISGIFGLIPK